MRISDDDRQRVVDELGRHLASGRIDLHEYSARVEEAYGAETLAEADHARRDLPFMRLELPGGGDDPWSAPPAGGSDAGRGWWRSRAVLALTALLVVAAVVVALVAQVAWVAVLVGGWVLGVAQGRAARSRR